MEYAAHHQQGPRNQKCFSQRRFCQLTAAGQFPALSECVSALLTARHKHHDEFIGSRVLGRAAGGRSRQQPPSGLLTKVPVHPDLRDRYVP